MHALDMTKGSPTRHLLTFLVPLLIGNICQQFYSFVDSAIVGRFVGSNALAAVGATGSITFLFFSFCMGAATGGGVVTSQVYGAGEKARVRQSITHSAYLVLFISVFMGVLGFLLARPVLSVLGTPESIMAEAELYLKVSCLGVPAVGIYNYISSMLRALGDSRTPLLFLIAASVLNVGLDLLFICVFGMGVFGAALATIIAQALSGLLCIAYALRTNPYFRLVAEDFRPDFMMLRSIARMGSTLAFQYSLIAISCMALQRVVNSFGPAVVAAFTVTSRIEQIVQQPFSSLGMAISTYSGQNYGAKLYDRIRLGFRKGMAIMAVYAFALIPVMYLFGSGISSIFTNDPEVLRYSGEALRITCWFYFFLGIIYVTRGVLNGVGDALFAFINGVVEVIGRVTIPLAITSIPFIGALGVWLSGGLVWLIASIACAWRYFSWRRKNMDGAGQGRSFFRRRRHARCTAHAA